MPNWPIRSFFWKMGASSSVVRIASCSRAAVITPLSTGSKWPGAESPAKSASRLPCPREDHHPESQPDVERRYEGSPAGTGRTPLCQRDNDRSGQASRPVGGAPPGTVDPGFRVKEPAEVLPDGAGND